jgi:transcriptional regulator with XRE-family HTH domain
MIIAKFADVPCGLDLERIGEAIAQGRTNLRLSYRELAERSGVSAPHIMRIEKGTADFSLSAFWRLCLSLGLPATDVLQWGIRTEWDFAIPPEINDSSPEWVDLTVWAIGNSPIPITTLHERAVQYVASESETLARCLIFSADAAESILSTQRSYHGLQSVKSAEEAFLKSLFWMHNLDRSLFFEALTRDPLAKLRAHGFFTFEILKEVTSDLVPPSASDATSPTLAASRRFYFRNLNKGQESVDKDDGSFQSPSVSKSHPVNFPDLIRRLANLTSTRGRKVALAREYGVSRQAVDNWLSGKSKPKSETLLRLLEWVQAEEAKQKSSAGADTPAEPKTTRTRKQSNEAKSESNPPKR